MSFFDNVVEKITAEFNNHLLSEEKSKPIRVYEILNEELKELNKELKEIIAQNKANESTNASQDKCKENFIIPETIEGSIVYFAKFAKTDIPTAEITVRTIDGIEPQKIMMRLYQFEHEPLWGYDCVDVENINEILEKMINEVKKYDTTKL